MSYTARCATRRSTATANLVLGACVTLFLVILCAGCLVFSWPANMEADYQGFGLLGALVPVVAIIGAFFVGMGTAQSVKEG